jgi:DNA-binding LacI/PurR family transcriptional regulator
MLVAMVTSQGSKPTLTSIARSLELSIATVSNVYNHPERVSQGVQQRVLDAARAAGYPGPDAVARQFRRGKSDTLGVLFTDELSFALRDPASVSFLSGVAGACEEAGLNLILIPAGPPLQANRITSVNNAIVDGFIIYSVPDDDPHLQTALSRNLPSVIVDEPDATSEADWVGLDEQAATFEIATMLLEQGHRRIGVITSRLGVSRYNGPADEARWSRARYAVQRNRILGLVTGLAGAGIAANALAVEERFDNSVEAGTAGLHALLDRHPDLTAICCFGDVLAIGALQGAAQRGLSVPDDLTITGYDDVPEAARVGLTTVRQPLIEKGRIAGQLFLTREDGMASRRRVLPTSLEVRRTSGPAPS